MCLAGIEILFSIPIAVYGMSLQVASAPLNPYVSWENVHVDFSRIDQIPAVIWRNGRGEVLNEAPRWIVVCCAFTFFLFFGFADEARKNYRSVFQSVAKRVGVSTGSTSFGNGFNSSDYGFEGCVYSFLIMRSVLSLTTTFFL